MTLEAELRQPTASQIIEPILKKHRISKNRFAKSVYYSIRKLTKTDDIVIPEFFDTAFSYTFIKSDKSVEGDFLRNKISVGYTNIVESIEQLKPGQVLVIPKHVNLVPNEAGNISNNPKKKFSKHGDVVKLKRYNSIDDAIQDRAHPKRLLKIAVTNTKMYKNYIGYDFQGVGDGRGSIYNKVMIEDIIEAKKIFMYCKDNGDETLEVVNYYNGNSFNNKSVKVRVSSVEKKERDIYEFDIDNLPLRKKHSRDYSCYANWTRIHSLHDCKGRIDSGLHRRTQRGTYNACKHMIAGFWEVMIDIKKKTKGQYYLINPFRCPTEELEEYANRLRTQVLIECYNPYKRRTELRKLTKIEREVLDWKRITLYGYKRNFN
ncbi:hypothetical protein DRJ17_02720 [Candidatus Woesearchaeota archaeon]|nr:MAG: hypothetical protein DRJ17_02720 [Candidatus Woesearchaeota archaeon]